VKDLSLYWGNFSCGTRQFVLSRQNGSIFPAQVANHSMGFDSSYPLAELAIQIDVVLPNFFPLVQLGSFLHTMWNVIIAVELKSVTLLQDII